MEYRMLTEIRTEEARRIRRKMRKKGKDWSPRRGKKLVPRKDNLANTLTTAKEDVNRLVLVIPKSISMPFKFTKDISPDTKTMEMQQKSDQKNYRILISWLQDFLARPLASQEDGWDSKIQEARCFLKSLGLLNKNSHAFYCLRTSKGFYLTTQEERSLPSYPRWMSLGMIVSGRCLTAKISESPRTGKGCSLSDILEEHVDPKYFLSEQIQQRLKLNFLGQQKVNTALGLEKET